MKKHAKFGASTSKRWLNCPGSIKLCETVPPPPESHYAAEGTAAHALAEASFEKLVSPLRLPLKHIDKKHHKFITNEMRGHVENFFNVVLEKANGIELSIESRVDLSFIHKEMFGTNDVSFIEPFGDLHVFDLKYGKGVEVDAVNNSQLAFYALGEAHRHKWAFERVHVHIYQPRVSKELRTWVLSALELEAWVDVFEKGVKACEKPMAPLKPGEWCKFCPALSVCPSVKAVAMKQTELDFKDDDKSLTDPSELAPEKLGKILEVKPLIEAWLESVAVRATHLLMNGTKVPGFKLTNRRSSRVWSNLERVEALAKKKFGDDAFQIKLKSPAQLEKIDGAFVKKHAVNVSQGVVLSKVDDKRPEVLMGPDKDFQDD